MQWHIGTSGWSYAPWAGDFYPKGAKRTAWLSHYAQHFDTVEINNSFYAPPKPEQLEKWQAMVPVHFLFSVKAPRLITHLKRLHEIEAPLADFLASIDHKPKIGPLIFQLPPRFPKQLDRLEALLRLLPPGRPTAIEFRDPDWHDDAVYRLLTHYNVAFCLFELADYHSPRVTTADFTYLRLHGRERNYRGRYSIAALEDWHGWLAARQRDAYVYFDNTAEKLNAIENALALRAMTH